MSAVAVDFAATAGFAEAAGQKAGRARSNSEQIEARGGMVVYEELRGLLVRLRWWQRLSRHGVLRNIRISELGKFAAIWKAIIG